MRDHQNVVRRLATMSAAITVITVALTVPATAGPPICPPEPAITCVPPAPRPKPMPLAPATMDGWDDGNDTQIRGDFLDRGHDQLLTINRSGQGNRLAIFDFSVPRMVSGVRLASFLHVEQWGRPSTLDGGDDADDLQVAGDFMGAGHDQLLIVNRGGTGGRLAIYDFTRMRSVGDGGLVAQARYWEGWGDSRALDGWLDVGDLLRVGDFLGRGHDQLLLGNRSRAGGRTAIADFSDGRAPAEFLHWEDWRRPR
jgi:hypothetical protein